MELGFEDGETFDDIIEAMDGEGQVSPRSVGIFHHEFDAITSAIETKYNFASVLVLHIDYDDGIQSDFHGVSVGFVSEGHY